MTEDEKTEEAPKGYLGDGVYVRFDGWAVWLYANDLDHPTDRICLEPEVWNNLKTWVAGLPGPMAGGKEKALESN